MGIGLSLDKKLQTTSLSRILDLPTAVAFNKVPYVVVTPIIRSFSRHFITEVWLLLWLIMQIFWKFAKEIMTHRLKNIAIWYSHVTVWSTKRRLPNSVMSFDILDSTKNTKVSEPSKPNKLIILYILYFIMKPEMGTKPTQCWFLRTLKNRSTPLRMWNHGHTLSTYWHWKGDCSLWASC